MRDLRNNRVAYTWMHTVMLRMSGSMLILVSMWISDTIEFWSCHPDNSKLVRIHDEYQTFEQNRDGIYITSASTPALAARAHWITNVFNGNSINPVENPARSSIPLRLPSISILSVSIYLYLLCRHEIFHLCSLPIVYNLWHCNSICNFYFCVISVVGFPISLILHLDSQSFIS